MVEGPDGADYKRLLRDIAVDYPEWKWIIIAGVCPSFVNVLKGGVPAINRIRRLSDATLPFCGGTN